MRIFSVYYTHKPGGFCQRLYRLLSALSASGHRVRYLTLDAPPFGSFGNSVEVTLLPFPIKARSGLLFWALFLILAPFLCAREAFRFKPDRFVVFGSFYSAMLLLARAVTAGRPTILFLRSLVFQIDLITKKPFLIRILSRLVDRIGIWSASRIICMTESMHSALCEFMGEAIPKHLLPNEAILPTNSEVLSTLLKLPLSEKIILTSGVLDERKNVSLLLTAVALANEPAHLVVAGNGKLRSQLEKEAIALKLSRVTFAGWIPNLRSYVGSCALVVHPSLSEGIPNSIMEALGAGVAVLASDIPEHRELLMDENLLFTLSAPDELAQKLIQFFSNPNTSSKIKKLSHETSLRYSFDWDKRAVDLATADL